MTAYLVLVVALVGIVPEDLDESIVEDRLAAAVGHVGLGVGSEADERGLKVTSVTHLEWIMI